MQDLTRRRLLVGLTLAATSHLVLPAAAQTAADADLERVLAPGARLRTLYSGGRWCEGLCWAPALGGLVFSDVRRNTLNVMDEDGSVRALRDPSNNANGNTLDGQGRLVTCEHRTRRVVRREADGTITVLAERFEDKPLNSPNDVALAPDGALWFTDPVFGIRQPDEGLMREPEQSARRVYRIGADGALLAVIDTVGQPNGLAFSPDGTTLYVSETARALNPEGAAEILAFPIGADNRAGGGRRFAPIQYGVADGLRVDGAGRLFAACEDGVHVYAPDGRMLGRVPTAGPCANLAFGGAADRPQLFIGQGPHIHAIDLAPAA